MLGYNIIVKAKKKECSMSLRIGQEFKSPLFMIEASGRSTINGRQACAVESAALKSGFNVVLVLTSPYLDLTDNTTCQLYKRIQKLQILTIQINSFASGSILGTFTFGLNHFLKNCSTN